MIAEGCRRPDRLTVDAAAPADRCRLAVQRIDTGAECRKAERAFHFRGYGPRSIALNIGGVIERGAAQPAARRQE